MKTNKVLLVILLIVPMLVFGQRRRSNTEPAPKFDAELYSGLKWRNIGPFRGGRSVASTGVVGDPMTYYMGTTGGGVWKTVDAGITWKNISDGFFETGTVGAVSVAESDPNVIYVGMGEHAIRGVMTSSGNGVYKSVDAGKTWEHIGLDRTMHISDVVIHPSNPDIVFVTAQGAQYGPTTDRGIYKSTDGGKNWRKVLYVNETTGAASLSMDMTNPRILYAAMWEHQRFPWTMKSGGENSGLYKSLDLGETWDKLSEGLPEEFGKSAVTVSRANPERLWAVIEAEGDKGGVYRSDNAGKKWSQVNKDRVNIARSWYYMEIYADPQNENVVYVANAPVTKSIDGGKTFTTVSTPHGDNHHIWINPNDNQNMINSNDGGANVSFNGGESWSSQQYQPTAQFYRVNTDNLVPYNVYGGQQDNSAIAIASRTNGNGITWKDWYSVAGCESAYAAFDPDDPDVVYGGCYQGIIEKWVRANNEAKLINQYPEMRLGTLPKDHSARFNWNAPIISSPHNREVIYHAGNVIYRTSDGGVSWDAISPDLTRDDESRQGPGGIPYTNEGAGGENYNTLMYIVESPHESGVIWSGSDDGLVHITRDGGENWTNVTPSGLQEGIINSIEVSPHNPAKAYITVMRYKFNDLTPLAFKTSDYGATWQRITNGVDDPNTFFRVVREDPKTPGLLYGGTETGLYVSFNDGSKWEKLQLNLPVVPINDLMIRQNDLVAATAGRSFWILDDLSTLQQSKGSFGENLTLYSPKDTYRLFGGSQDEPTPGIGQNPKEGVTFDYYLPNELDSTELTLKVIFDDEVIRTTSSEKDESFKSWPGGPPRPAVLPSKKGVNRFTWDFRRETLPAVDGVFVYGDYRGSRVAPGQYTLRLILEDDSVETLVNILPNPSIQASNLDFNQQQDIMTALEGMIKDIHKSVNTMRSARKQLKAYQDLLKDNEEAQALTDTAKSIVEKIDEWESDLIQPKQKTFQDVINFHNQLNAHIMYLKSFLDTADPTVSRGSEERFEDLKAQWQEFAERRDEIIDEEFGGFNQMYRDAGLPAIIVK